MKILMTKITENKQEKSFHWYQKAAENGNAYYAMNNLAICYEKGEGTEKNLEKAFYWYQKAAENGNAYYAMNNLAICYEKGEGTEKILEKAFYWSQKAAENREINLNSEVYKSSCEECNQQYIYFRWCQQCNS